MLYGFGSTRSDWDNAADNLGREFKVSAQLVARESTGAPPPANRKRERKVAIKGEAK
jgi:hypothetical protein